MNTNLDHARNKTQDTSHITEKTVAGRVGYGKILHRISVDITISSSSPHHQKSPHIFGAWVTK
jgi:hypothetical protein